MMHTLHDIMSRRMKIDLRNTSHDPLLFLHFHIYITITVTEETFLVRLHCVLFMLLFLLLCFSQTHVSIGPVTENNFYSSVWYICALQDNLN